VSAILNALKKLEQETSEPSGNPLRPEIHRRGEWRKAALAGMMALTVILCGLAGYSVVVLTRKAPVSPVSSIPASTIDRKKAAVLPPTVPVSPAPSPSRAIQPVTAPPPYQTTISGKPLGLMNNAETPAPEEEVVAIPLDEEQPAEDIPEAALSPDAALPDEALPADEVLLEDEAPPADRPKSDRVSKAVTGIFNDPEVVLQAISWASDRARRMAVINGKICRESGQINGYVILQINPEDVVVSKGSVTGRLVFKIR